MRWVRVGLFDDEWPEDFPGYVFLGRAIQAYGRMLHKDQWTGTERLVELGDPWNFQTDRAGLSRKDEALARALFETRFPLEDCFDASDWTDDQWRAVAEEQCRLVQANQRWESTVRALLEQLRSGALSSFARPHEGGAMEPLPAHLWNFEGWRLPMVDLSINLNDAFNGDTERSHYLYVSRADLAQTAGSWSDTLPTPSEWALVSPYLKFAIALSAFLKLGPDRQPSVKEIMDEIPRHGPPLPNLQNSQISKEKMASFMRYPPLGSAPK